jgi:hypothetical protein
MILLDSISDVLWLWLRKDAEQDILQGLVIITHFESVFKFVYFETSDFGHLKLSNTAKSSCMMGARSATELRMLTHLGLDDWNDI